MAKKMREMRRKKRLPRSFTVLPLRLEMAEIMADLEWRP